jgi:hypothetical protein
VRSLICGSLDRAHPFVPLAVCRECIEAHVTLADGAVVKCPVCSRPLGTAPFSSGELRFDRALTALCARVFGGVDIGFEESKAQELRREDLRGEPPEPAHRVRQRERREKEKREDEEQDLEPEPYGGGE